MYRPLGTGDVDVDAIVSVLGRSGYQGWSVLEQDTILTGEPPGEGPVADVRTSAEYVRSVLSKAGKYSAPAGPAVAGDWRVRAEALACFVASVGIAVGSSRTIDATSRLP